MTPSKFYIKLPYLVLSGMLTLSLLPVIIGKFNFAFAFILVLIVFFLIYTVFRGLANMIT
jgi:hypothetical protein